MFPDSMAAHERDARPAISASGLVKNFGTTKALDHLDLTVTAGEVHGFLGPNGAGKTTTIRILLGLLRKSGGEVRLLGEHLCCPGGGGNRGDPPAEPHPPRLRRSSEASHQLGSAGAVRTPSHGKDDLRARVLHFEVPDGLGSLAQRVGPVDDRGDLSGLDEFSQRCEVLPARSRRQLDQPMPDEA
jgi:energy-coupling factor transporter ATP-binding protein EcfA2